MSGIEWFHCRYFICAKMHFSPPPSSLTQCHAIVKIPSNAVWPARTVWWNTWSEPSTSSTTTPWCPWLPWRQERNVQLCNFGWLSQVLCLDATGIIIMLMTSLPWNPQYCVNMRVLMALTQTSPPVFVCLFVCFIWLTSVQESRVDHCCGQNLCPCGRCHQVPFNCYM